MSIFEVQKKQSKICNVELTKIFYGSAEKFQKIKDLIELVKKIFPKEIAYKFYEQDRVSQIKTAYTFLAAFIRSNPIDFAKDELPIEFNFFVNFEIPGSVSALMVRPIIAVLCTESQKKKWLPLFDTAFVFGAYAQTELGHGSDVQSLETEALFDENTREFIINSPNVSSYKWWPGELSNLASVAIVFAKTIIKGKKAGVLPFIVQIRDFITHQPMSGIEIGDIGPKFGYFSKENGFLKFSNVRIPLENMPARFSEVSGDGQIIKKGNPKIIYSSMMRSRSALLEMSALSLGKAVAIAIRYSHLRRQFKNELKEEMPIIQYQLQQYRLFPLLAKTYAMRCAFNKISNVINECNAQIAENDFRNLQEVHIILSGSKAMYTWWCGSGLMVCMNCCGGHGFSKYSGITHIIESFAPNTILEGENSMLMLQVGAFLLKCMRHVHEGKLDKVTGYCQYLKNVDQLTSFNVKFNEDLLVPDLMKQMWQKSVLNKLTQIGESMMEELANMSVMDIVGKKVGIKVFESAKLHIILLTYDYFVQHVNEITHSETRDSLLKLAQLFIVEQTVENAQLLMSLGVISGEQINKLKNTIEGCLESISKDCLMLADILLPDDQVNYSPISETNEKPYENLYNLAKKMGMVNSTDLTGHYLSTIRKASLETYSFPRL